MTIFSIEKQNLMINNQKIEFTHNISKVIEINGVLIVLLLDSLLEKQSIKINEQPLNNIYAVNFDGGNLWNIKDVVSEDNLYTDIDVNRSNFLVVTDFYGIRKTIDTQKKLVTGQDFVK